MTLVHGPIPTFTLTDTYTLRRAARDLQRVRGFFLGNCVVLKACFLHSLAYPPLRNKALTCSRTQTTVCNTRQTARYDCPVSRGPRLGPAVTSAHAANNAAQFVFAPLGGADCSQSPGTVVRGCRGPRSFFHVALQMCVVPSGSARLRVKNVGKKRFDHLLDFVSSFLSRCSVRVAPGE